MAGDIGADNRVGQGRERLVARRRVDGEMVCRSRPLSESVVDWRKPHGHGRFLVSWQMRNGRFIKPGSRVDVNRVGHVLARLGRVARGRMRGLVLASRRQQQAAIGRKSQAPEKRGERFIGIEI